MFVRIVVPVIPVAKKKITTLYNMFSHQQSNYYFNNLGRIGLDNNGDSSQRNIMDTKFANHILSNYYNQDKYNIVDFATENQMQYGGTVWGHGLNGQQTQVENSLKYSPYVHIQRPLVIDNANVKPRYKYKEQPRQFLTVPYLGKGYGDPTLESKLQQGERSDYLGKSISSITLKEYPKNYAPILHPDQEANANADGSIEPNWVRGGINTRQINYDITQSRPNPRGLN
jgi:hypothetical protein